MQNKLIYCKRVNLKLDSQNYDYRFAFLDRLKSLILSVIVRMPVKCIFEMILGGNVPFVYFFSTRHFYHIVNCLNQGLLQPGNITGFKNFKTLFF